MANTASLQVESPRTLESGIFAYAALYMPTLLAWAFSASPIVSFGIAWAGSWWIFWLSMTGRVRPLPGDRSWGQQLFRPLLLAQIMFFGLFCFASIFYMWDLVGTGGIVQGTEAEIRRTAAAQRYYVLGHAAFVHGILALMDYRRSGEWTLRLGMSLSRFFLYAAIGAFACSVLFDTLPGLGQFAGKFQYLFVVASVLAFAYALRKGDTTVAVLAGAIYGAILLEVLVSGWKHEIIIVVGLLLLLLFPEYKKTMSVVGVVFAILFATLLPAYNGVLRELNWRGSVNAEQAAEVAFNRATSGEIDIGKRSWRFLSNRLTTVGLFTDYIQSVPSQRPYYGLSTVEQGVYSVIPSVVWPNKPRIEELVMQRAYENTTISPNSIVSAKPKIIPDGYLAGGWIGVLLTCFALGGIASIASRYAERWFGGYEIGGQLVFTALFARNLFVPSYEFLFNALFWSFVLLALLAFGLWITGILQRNGS